MRTETLDAAFERFHAENPQVYDALRALAYRWKDAGHSRCSIGMLFEVARWHVGVKTTDHPYTLNNNHRSRYARLLMERNPDLDGFFSTRELWT